MMTMIMIRMMITTMMYLPEDRKRSTSLHSYLWYVERAAVRHFMLQNITCEVKLKTGENYLGKATSLNGV